MATIKMTSKRQATFPVELCKDMGIVPGDDLMVEHKLIKGDLVWVLKPVENKLEWMGALKKYARNKSHEMDDVRRNIANAGKR